MKRLVAIITSALFVGCLAGCTAGGFGEPTQTLTSGQSSISYPEQWKTVEADAETLSVWAGGSGAQVSAVSSDGTISFDSGAYVVSYAVPDYSNSLDAIEQQWRGADVTREDVEGSTLLTVRYSGLGDGKTGFLRVLGTDDYVYSLAAAWLSKEDAQSSPGLLDKMLGTVTLKSGVVAPTVSSTITVGSLTVGHLDGMEQEDVDLDSLDYYNSTPAEASKMASDQGRVLVMRYGDDRPSAAYLQDFWDQAYGDAGRTELAGAQAIVMQDNPDGQLFVALLNGENVEYVIECDISDSVCDQYPDILDQLRGSISLA